MSDPTRFDEDDSLRDPALRRALDHAPDRDAAPDPSTREAILKMAHNLAEAPASGSAASAGAARGAGVLPWWRRLFGGGGEPRSRMPWNAAFATVLVAAFVTVLWRSEPVPEARLDGEARVGGAPAAGAPAPTATRAAPAAPASPSTAAAPEAAREAASPPAVVAEPAPVPASPPPQAAAPAADQRAKVLREPSSAKEAARTPALSKQATPSLAAPAPPPGAAEQAAPAAPVARAAPAARPSADASALARRGEAQADVSGALRDASPDALATTAPPRAAAPSFAALERWTSFSTSDGGARRVRGDVEGMPALLGAVARSATTPDAPLDAPVEVRLALYRGNALVAVMEIAGRQVRWTPQPDGTAWVGTPPTQALDALRSLLKR